MGVAVYVCIPNVPLTHTYTNKHSLMCMSVYVFLHIAKGGPDID